MKTEFEQYSAEAKEKWGHTDAYKEYEQKQSTVYSYLTKKQGATNTPCFLTVNDVLKEQNF